MGLTTHGRLKRSSNSSRMTALIGPNRSSNINRQVAPTTTGESTEGTIASATMIWRNGILLRKSCAINSPRTSWRGSAMAVMMRVCSIEDHSRPSWEQPRVVEEAGEVIVLHQRRDVLEAHNERVQNRIQADEQNDENGRRDEQVLEVALSQNAAAHAELGGYRHGIDWNLAESMRPATRPGMRIAGHCQRRRVTGWPPRRILKSPADSRGRRSTPCMHRVVDRPRCAQSTRPYPWPSDRGRPWRWCHRSPTEWRCL